MDNRSPLPALVDLVGCTFWLLVLLLMLLDVLECADADLRDCEEPPLGCCAFMDDDATEEDDEIFFFLLTLLPLFDVLDEVFLDETLPPFRLISLAAMASPKRAALDTFRNMLMRVVLVCWLLCWIESFTRFDHEAQTTTITLSPPQAHTNTRFGFPGGPAKIGFLFCRGKPIPIINSAQKK